MCSLLAHRPLSPSTFMPLPSRNTSECRPFVLDTVLLPCSFLPPSAKETRSDCLCPDERYSFRNRSSLAGWTSRTSRRIVIGHTTENSSVVNPVGCPP